MTAARIALGLAAFAAAAWTTTACTYDKHLGDTTESVDPDPDPDLDLDAALFSGCSTDGVEVVATGPGHVPDLLLASDGSTDTLYWSVGDEGVVMMTSRSEDDDAFGEPVPFAFSASPGRLAQDADNVYWTEMTPGVLGYASKSGGTTTFLETGLDEPSAIIADGVHIYWAHNDNGIVYRRPVSGDTREVVATEQGRMGARAFAQDDAHLYWVRSEDETIMHLAKAGGTPEVFALDTGPIGTIAIDAEHVYWTRPSAGDLEDSIWRKPRDGSAQPVPIALHLISAGLMDVDDQHVYFRTVGSVMRVDKSGGEPQTVHEDFPFNNVFSPGGDMQLGDEYVYWSQTKCDAIFRIAKADLN